MNGKGHPHQQHHHHHQDDGNGHTETVVRVDAGGSAKASWVAVSSLVLSLVAILGGATATVYERGAKEATLNDLTRRMVSIEADGGRFAQLNAQRISSIEGQIILIKADQAQMAAKAALQGERLAEINGKLDTLLERTRPGPGASH